MIHNVCARLWDVLAELFTPQCPTKCKSNGIVESIHKVRFENKVKLAKQLKVEGSVGYCLDTEWICPNESFYRTKSELPKTQYLYKLQ